MTCEEEEKPRRKGASNYTLTLSGILSIAALLASGVATYNAIQNDIATLKRGETYQERTNDLLRGEIKSVRDEQRETMREFNEKLDRIIEHWPNQRRR